LFEYKTLTDSSSLKTESPHFEPDNNTFDFYADHPEKPLDIDEVYLKTDIEDETLFRDHSEQSGYFEPACNQLHTKSADNFSEIPTNSDDIIFGKKSDHEYEKIRTEKIVYRIDTGMSDSIKRLLNSGDTTNSLNDVIVCQPVTATTLNCDLNQSKSLSSSKSLLVPADVEPMHENNEANIEDESEALKLSLSLHFSPLRADSYIEDSIVSSSLLNDEISDLSQTIDKLHEEDRRLHFQDDTKSSSNTDETMGRSYMIINETDLSTTEKTQPTNELDEYFEIWKDMMDESKLRGEIKGLVSGIINNALSTLVLDPSLMNKEDRYEAERGMDINVKESNMNGKIKPKSDNVYLLSPAEYEFESDTKTESTISDHTEINTDSCDESTSSYYVTADEDCTHPETRSIVSKSSSTSYYTAVQSSNEDFTTTSDLVPSDNIKGFNVRQFLTDLSELGNLSGYDLVESMLQDEDLTPVEDENKSNPFGFDDDITVKQLQELSDELSGNDQSIQNETFYIDMSYLHEHSTQNENRITVEDVDNEIYNFDSYKQISQNLPPLVENPLLENEIQIKHLRPDSNAFVSEIKPQHTDTSSILEFEHLEAQFEIENKNLSQTNGSIIDEQTLDESYHIVDQSKMTGEYCIINDINEVNLINADEPKTDFLEVSLSDCIAKRLSRTSTSSLESSNSTKSDSLEFELKEKITISQESFFANRKRSPSPPNITIMDAHIIPTLSNNEDCNLTGRTIYPSDSDQSSMATSLISDNTERLESSQCDTDSNIKLVKRLTPSLSMDLSINTTKTFKTSSYSGEDLPRFSKQSKSSFNGDENHNKYLKPKKQAVQNSTQNDLSSHFKHHSLNCYCGGINTTTNSSNIGN
jgi:hypothetical protein